MVRRVRDEHGADDLRSRHIHHDFIAQSELPRRIRLIPRHLVKYRPQLRAQLFERPDPLGVGGERWLRWTRRQAVEFVARRHHKSETRQLREVRGELAKCARLRVRAPIVSATGDAIEHASGRRELRFEIREQSREGARAFGRLARPARRFLC